MPSASLSKKKRVFDIAFRHLPKDLTYNFMVSVSFGRLIAKPKDTMSSFLPSTKRFKVIVGFEDSKVIHASYHVCFAFCATSQKPFMCSNNSKLRLDLICLSLDLDLLNMEICTNPHKQRWRFRLPL
jgi:hypothetical protein